MPVMKMIELQTGSRANDDSETFGLSLIPGIAPLNMDSDKTYYN
jgi:hypothetical protein